AARPGRAARRGPPAARQAPAGRVRARAAEGSVGQEDEGDPQADLRGRSDHLARAGAAYQGGPGGGAGQGAGRLRPSAGRVHLPALQGGVRGSLRAGTAPLLPHRPGGVPLPRVRQGLLLPRQPRLPPPLAQTASARRGRGPEPGPGRGDAEGGERRQRQRAGHAEPRRSLGGGLRGGALRVSPLRQAVPPASLPAQAPAGARRGGARGSPGTRTGPGARRRGAARRRVPPLPRLRGDLPQQEQPGAAPAPPARRPGLPLQVLPGHLLQLSRPHPAHQQVPPVG
ncbi:hypothetical protein Nmel_003495, partial [Mimus melanotis]